MTRFELWRDTANLLLGANLFRTTRPGECFEGLEQTRHPARLQKGLASTIYFRPRPLTVENGPGEREAYVPQITA